MNILSDFFSPLEEFELRQTYGVGVGGEEVSRFEKFMKHTGYETPNEYEIYRGEEKLGLVQETRMGRDLIPFSLKKAFLSKRRGILFTVTDESGNIVCYVKKPWHLLVSTNIALDSEQQLPLGFVWRRLDPLFNKYDLLSEEKKLFACIKSSVAKPWTFPVLSPSKLPGGELRGIKTHEKNRERDSRGRNWERDGRSDRESNERLDKGLNRGREIGKIQKKLPSLGQAMTYRETIHIRLHSDFSPKEKATFLATALAIAIDKFEGTG